MKGKVFIVQDWDKWSPTTQKMMLDSMESHGVHSPGNLLAKFKIGERRESLPKVHKLLDIIVSHQKEGKPVHVLILASTDEGSEKK